jgi:hypothetical protein
MTVEFGKSSIEKTRKERWLIREVSSLNDGSIWKK